jgi:carboxypeptidase Q
VRRYSDAELAAEALAPDPSPRSPFAAPIPIAGRSRTPGCPVQQRLPGQPYDPDAAQKQRNRINKFLTDEGVLVAVSPSYRGQAGLVFSSAAGSRDEKDPLPPPSVALTAEHYDRIARLIQRKQPVRLEFDIQNRFYDETKDSFNVTAELPGTGKSDQIVMMGAHLDSWTFGEGATDNAAGCAVMLEALRILKTLDLKLPRTVRIGLWGGEEEGLIGSKAYVAQHFADPADMKLKPEHEKVSGYFNFDNGTGKIRGVYLQGNDMMRPVFEAWLAPFKDMGATTVTIRDTGGTDHLSFDAVGLPGFQFIQDSVEYATRTHHSNMDVFDRLQAGDLVQASAIVASVVYHAAMREEMLPRKPLPKPQARAGSRRN